MILGSFIGLSLYPIKYVKQILETAGNVMGRTEVVIIDVGDGIQLSIYHDHFDLVPAIKMLEYIDCAVDELGIKNKLSEKIIELLLRAEAESHNTEIDNLYLHETGSPDTIVDIVGISYFYDVLNLHNTKIYATPISVGYGYVNTAHGLLEVPPPATRRILNGLRWVYGPYEGEMTTPTGAAIVKCLLTDQINDVLKLQYKYRKIGIGFGTRKFPKSTSVKLLVVDDSV